MPPSYPPLPRTAPRRGFTLIELLTVIAVIGILASILVPVVGSVRRAANKNRSLVLFTKITNAFDAYKADNGRYPIFPELSATHNTSSVNGESDYTFLINDSSNLLRRVLTADNAYIASTTAPGTTNYNRTARKYLDLDDNMISTVEPGSLTNPKIIDGFGNDQIVVVVHLGNVREIDRGSFLKAVTDSEGNAALAPSVVRNLPQGIALYSLIQNVNNDPLNSLWCTNWTYDDYSK